MKLCDKNAKLGATIEDESVYSTYWSNIDNSEQSSIRLAAPKTQATENPVPSPSSLPLSSPASTKPNESKPSITEPLHLLIGGDDVSSAEGYAIRRLEDDFLTGGQCYELPVSLSPVHSNSYEWRGAVPRRPPVGRPGHSRSASYGSAQQIHVNVPTQQPIPCLPNVSVEPSLPRSHPVGNFTFLTLLPSNAFFAIVVKLVRFFVALK